MADFLILQDLFNRAGSDTISGYFDDNLNGTLTDEDSIVDDILMSAEGEMFSRMLRAYSTKDVMITLVNNDPTLKSHVAWIACELASERRSTFTDDEGWGPFKMQYNRAIEYIERLSKGLQRSTAESLVGQGANTGGNLSPSPPQGTARQFIFSPSKQSPTGHGGFIFPLALSLGEMLKAMVEMT